MGCAQRRGRRRVSPRSTHPALLGPMHSDKPSRTAAHVAALRGLGAMLPPSARLIDDPWGAEWTGFGRLRRLAQAMPAAAQWLSRPAWRWLIYMQVRTFALDQEVVRFAQAGGRQLVLLGAGLDARALRLRRLGLRVFEVDHPATQARKRELLGDAATSPPIPLSPSPIFPRRNFMSRRGASGSSGKPLRDGANPGASASNRSCFPRGLPHRGSSLNATTPPGCWRHDGCRRTSLRNSKEISGG
jgi:leucine carboxyl methyltransferase